MTARLTVVSQTAFDVGWHETDQGAGARSIERVTPIDAETLEVMNRLGTGMVAVEEYSL